MANGAPSPHDPPVDTMMQEYQVAITDKHIVLQAAHVIQKLPSGGWEIGFASPSGTLYSFLISDEQRADVVKQLTGGIEVPT